MCGIAGVISYNNNVRASMLERLQGALKHRGPDGNGYAISKNVGLTMRRLSIIDVKGGDQPLFNEDKSIEIVGNGEIYNYLELQKELKAKGHKLRTGSDIETAIHAYEEWGLKAPEKFTGQFALALHDKKLGRVILIRDRMGEKPLYHTSIAGDLVFASELKALVNLPGFNKTLDTEAINYFFHFYYIPEPFTPFMNVKKIQSGSMWVIDLNKKTQREIFYWKPEDIRPSNNYDPTKNIKKLFSDACKLTLRSDVPVGVSLSGGVDSGAILAFSAPEYKEVMNAFSVGYEGSPPSDERKAAKDLAKKFKVNFIEKEIKVKDVVKDFPETVWRSDDPIADIAAYSIYQVSKLARRHGVKVLLGGVGGDELFWGYPSTIEAVNQNIKNSKMVFGKKFLYNNPNPKNTAYLLTKLYTKSFTQKLKDKDCKNIFSKYPVKNAQTAEKSTFNSVRDLWLKSDVITLGDRMSMAASVELRSPFLDYNLTESVMKSKKCMSSYNLGQKYYFKKAMESVLPPEVLNRPKKGFTPPVAQWLSAINKKYVHLLKNGFLVREGVLDGGKTSIVSFLLKSVPTYSVYQLLVMEIWGREFVWNQSVSEIK